MYVIVPPLPLASLCHGAYSLLSPGTTMNSMLHLGEFLNELGNCQLSQ